jgi:hypothetical protein
MIWINSGYDSIEQWRVDSTYITCISDLVKITLSEGPTITYDNSEQMALVGYH